MCVWCSQQLSMVYLSHSHSWQQNINSGYEQQKVSPQAFSKLGCYFKTWKISMCFMGKHFLSLFFFSPTKFLLYSSMSLLVALSWFLMVSPQLFHSAEMLLIHSHSLTGSRMDQKLFFFLFYYKVSFFPSPLTLLVDFSAISCNSVYCVLCIFYALFQLEQ